MHEQGPDANHRKVGPTRNGEFVQTLPTGVDIILFVFVSRRRTTFMFGPTSSEASTRSYVRLKKCRRKQNGRRDGHVAQSGPDNAAAAPNRRAPRGTAGASRRAWRRVVSVRCGAEL